MTIAALRGQQRQHSFAHQPLIKFPRFIAAAIHADKTNACHRSSEPKYDERDRSSAATEFVEVTKNMTAEGEATKYLATEGTEITEVG